MNHSNDTDGDALSLVTTDAQVHQQNEHHHKWSATHHHKTLKQHKPHRKINHTKHLSFEAIPLTLMELPTQYYNTPTKQYATIAAYTFIFYREINPPPPKFC